MQVTPIPKPKRIKDKKAIANAKKPYCQCCKKWGRVEVHHIRSRGSGGDDSPENLISLCRLCHAKAHNGQISREELKWNLKT